MKPQSALASILNNQSYDPLFTSPEAATYIGVAENTLSVWRCVGRYNIPFVKVGRLVRYRKSALDAFLERRTIDKASNESGPPNSTGPPTKELGRLYKAPHEFVGGFLFSYKQTPVTVPGDLGSQMTGMSIP